MTKTQTALRSFEPNAASAAPLAVQLADHIRTLIRGGELHRGDSLPPAGSLGCASRVTVLQAYRILQDERLVLMRRASGTVVCGEPSAPVCALLLDRPLFGRSPAVYFGQIVNAVLSEVVSRGWQPRIYLLDSLPGEAGESRIPEALQRDVADGLPAGALVWRPSDLPQIHEWLKLRRIPAVSLRHVPELPCIQIDHRDMAAQGLNHLAERGARIAEVWDTLGDATLHLPAGKALSPRSLSVRWRRFTVGATTAVGMGREAARELLRHPRALPEAIFILDDWMAIGAVQELLAAGVRIPQDIRLLVATHRGQINDALLGCDLLVVDPAEIAASAVDLLQTAIAGTAGDLEKRRVQYVLVPRDSRTTATTPSGAAEEPARTADRPPPSRGRRGGRRATGVRR